MGEDAPENFHVPDEYQAETKGHDRGDVRDLNAELIEVLSTDIGDEHGRHPFVAGHHEQSGVSQATHAREHSQQALHAPWRQPDQCVHTQVPGGTHSVGHAKENQPAEQRLGQRHTPSHFLGNPH